MFFKKEGPTPEIKPLNEGDYESIRKELAKIVEDRLKKTIKPEEEGEIFQHLVTKLVLPKIGVRDFAPEGKLLQLTSQRGVESLSRFLSALKQSAGPQRYFEIMMVMLQDDKKKSTSILLCLLSQIADSIKSHPEFLQKYFIKEDGSSPPSYSYDQLYGLLAKPDNKNLELLTIIYFILDEYFVYKHQQDETTFLLLPSQKYVNDNQSKGREEFLSKFVQGIAVYKSNHASRDVSYDEQPKDSTGKSEIEKKDGSGAVSPPKR